MLKKCKNTHPILIFSLWVIPPLPIFLWTPPTLISNKKLLTGGVTFLNRTALSIKDTNLSKIRRNTVYSPWALTWFVTFFSKITTLTCINFYIFNRCPSEAARSQYERNRGSEMQRTLQQNAATRSPASTPTRLMESRIKPEAQNNAQRNQVGMLTKTLL